MSETTHVYPLNDLREHTVDGDDGHVGKCDCNPRIEWVNGSRLVVHNSYDGRELLEEKFSEIIQ